MCIYFTDYDLVRRLSTIHHSLTTVPVYIYAHNWVRAHNQNLSYRKSYYNMQQADNIICILTAAHIAWSSTITQR